MFDSLENYMAHFDLIFGLKTFFFEAVYMVYLTDPVDNCMGTARSVFASLLSRNVFYALVVVTRRDHTLVVYNLNFYYETFTCCQNPTLNLIDTCEDGRLAKNAFLNSTFPLLPNLFGCSMNVLSLKYPPYIIDQNNGFEVSILRTLEEVLNMTFRLLIDESGSGWGNRNPDGKWTGRLGRMRQDKILGIGNLIVTDEIQEDFTYSQDYYNQLMKWVVPVAEIVPRWKVIFIIFQWQLWISCLVLVVVAAFLFRIFSNDKNEVVRCENLVRAFLISFSVFIGVPHNIPSTFLMRNVFILLTFFNLIANNFYQTYLISYLTNNQYEKQLETNAEIVESGLQIGGLGQYKDIFIDSNNTNFQKVEQLYLTFSEDKDNTVNWLKMVGDDRNTVTVLGYFYTQYLIATNNSATCRPNGSPKISILPEILRSYPIRIVSSKNHILIDPIDRIITRLVNHGFIVKWTYAYLAMVEKAEKIRKSAAKKTSNTQFTLEHVEGSFLILGSGFGFALLCFVGEIFYPKLKRLVGRRGSKIRPVYSIHGKEMKLYFLNEKNDKNILRKRKNIFIYNEY